MQTLRGGWARGDALRRLRRSPQVARGIPASLRILDVTIVLLALPLALLVGAAIAYAWEGEILARAQAVDRARVYRHDILPYKVAIDLGYAEDHSVRGDLALLARTVALPVLRVGRRLHGLIAGPD